MRFWCFLIGDISVANDILIDYYIQNDSSKLVQIGENSYRLKYAEKKQLLKNCIIWCRIRISMQQRHANLGCC